MQSCLSSSKYREDSCRFHAGLHGDLEKVAFTSHCVSQVQKKATAHEPKQQWRRNRVPQTILSAVILVILLSCGCFASLTCIHLCFSGPSMLQLALVGSCMASMIAVAAIASKQSFKQSGWLIVTGRWLLLLLAIFNGGLYFTSR